jgi:hypothetical protein
MLALADAARQPMFDAIEIGLTRLGYGNTTGEINISDKNFRQ